eukprot:CAMPEP_0170632716 /NCGR_PEP_ID=MMETSP0224-20130122/35492_1 /TAXON_ID=285029 /ORGANISM="Togula jolla, Strain CCCM 725" /LENGTH=43 /DNA_ID= /DNA_START= /DNA_END= /DNA_ORIENTATION=
MEPTNMRSQLQLTSVTQAATVGKRMSWGNRHPLEASRCRTMLR